MSNSLQLIKEAIRQTNHLEPFNEEIFRRTLGELNTTFREAQQISAESVKSDSIFDEMDQTSLGIMKSLIEREKRNLSSYVGARASFVAHAASSLSVLPQSMVDCLTLIERDFFDSYISILSEFSAELGTHDLDLLLQPQTPGDYFIQIRVNRDCGSIQTESGLLHLTANSLHFVRRVDVQSLIEQGYVSHVS